MFTNNYTLENTEGAIKNRLSRETGNTKGQSKIDYPEKLATYGTQDTRRIKKTHKKQHNMCWTPPYTNKHA